MHQIDVDASGKKQIIVLCCPASKKPLLTQLQKPARLKSTNFSFSCDHHDEIDDATVTTRTASNPQADWRHNQEKDSEMAVSERR